MTDWNKPPDPPKPLVNDADRPRWVRDDMAYKQALSQYNDWQNAKYKHPELKWQYQRD